MKKLLASLPFVFAAACGETTPPPDRCPTLPDPGADAVTTTLPIDLVAGDAPVTLGANMLSPSGASWALSKLKLYASQPKLMKADGGHVHPLLVDEDGAALPYGVALVDAARPASLALRMKAPPGAYTGLSFTVGVPDFCADDQTPLNHADASTMQPPLDVDSDMYWSWDPGYVFLKVEGRVDDDGPKPFFYHVGDEGRLMTVSVDGAIEDGARLTADVSRLFVTPQGAHAPRLDGDDDDRKVHGGPLADQVKENVEGSGFFAWAGGDL